MFADEPTETAAEREPRDAGDRDEPTRRGQAVWLQCVVDLTPRAPCLDAHRPRRRIDGDRFHQGQVDDQSAVADGKPGDVVTRALDREHQALLARKRQRLNDVVHGGASRDERRVAIDHRVEDSARRLVPFVVWCEQLTR